MADHDDDDRRPPQVLKAPTGIPGLDAITGGGLPARRTTVLVGGAGSGKTVLSLQIAVNGARLYGEPGVYVSLEEPTDHVRAHAAGFKWGLDELGEDMLRLVDAEIPAATVIAGEFDLTGLLAAVGAVVEQMGATRVVFDGLDAPLSLLDDSSLERRELVRLHQWLTQRGLTGVVTAHAATPEAVTVARHEFMPFMADCVISLRTELHERVSLRTLRVVKYRGSGFAGNEVPMVIGERGVDLPGVGPELMDHPVSDERVSSGVPRLDVMLGGGYFRGSSVLITGVPGTAKTTLCGAYAAAACRRGERVLYLSFDEVAAQIARNLRSVGIDLGPHQESGLLHMEGHRVEARSVEGHVAALIGVLDEFQPRHLVIDPLSAITKSGGEVAAIGSTLGLLQHAKQRGVTVVCSSLISGPDALSPEERTPVHMSTQVDTWMHLAYVLHGGERNRTISIIKSRGSEHSNQMRELVLSDRGVHIEDAYMAEGEVLLGTARWEKERADERAIERVRAELARRGPEFEQAAAEAEAQIAAIRARLAVKRAEMNQLAEEEADRRSEMSRAKAYLSELRGGDEPDESGGPAPPPDIGASGGPGPEAD